MLSLYLGGGEINAFGELLESMGVDTIAVSFMGLRRRIKHLDKILLADRFSPSTKILLDSGCHTINGAPDNQYSDEELKEIATEYREFVRRNHERIHVYTEFDAFQLGTQWIADQRTDDDKLIVVWHEEEGVELLETLARDHPRVGVTGTALGDRDLTPLLNRLVRDHVTEIYGLGMSKPEQMAAIQWTGVTSTSWLSPVKFRDLIIWTGTELKRYPKKNREMGKKRHRTYIRDIGLDPDLIEGDDNNELLRLSVWSWIQQVASINGHSPTQKVVTNPSATRVSANAESGTDSVDHYGDSVRSFGVPTQRTKRLLPGMAVDTKDEVYHNAEGTRLTRQLKIVRTTSESVLQCSGCYLAGKCPAFEPGAACIYEIPVEIRTKDQLAAVQAALIEMQTKRVLRGSLMEEVEGGYMDPNLSAEMDRLNRLIKTRHEMEAEGFSLTIKANQSASATHAGAGVLSRIFGREASEPARELPAVVQVKSVAEQMGIIEDAEVIEDAA